MSGFWDNNEPTIVGAALSAASAGLFWLVRTVLTNGRKIELIEQRTAMQHAEMTRAMETMSKELQAVTATNNVAIATQGKMVALLERVATGNRHEG